MFRQTHSFKGIWLPWLWWVLASSIGAALGVAITLMAMAAFGGDDDRVMVVLAPAVAVGIGMMQWLVLRRHIPQAAWWTLVSITGGLIGAVVIGGVASAAFAILGMDLVTRTMQGTVANVASLSLYGAGIGLMQWLFLRRHVMQTGWWVLASIIGWALLGVMVGESLESLAELTLFGTVPALTTGFVLARLLRQPVSGFSSEEPSAGRVARGHCWPPAP